MSLVFRLARTSLHRQFLSAQRCVPIILTKMKSSQACQASDSQESHDEKNMRLGRPQSPHLTIYAAQMTSMLSITQRATGLVLAGYTILFALAALVLPDSISNYLEDLECASIGAAAIMLLKLLFAVPLSYHFWNGIRHLIWDTNHCLRLRHVYLTGYIMLLVVTGSAAILVML